MGYVQKQYQSCISLLDAGADPDYRPSLRLTIVQGKKRNQFLLMGGLSNDDVEAFRCLLRVDDFIDEQNYTMPHRTILGLLMANLEEEICLRPEDVNITDVTGQTPLAWAVCRGDDRAVVTLLSLRTEVNTVDGQHSEVVGHDEIEVLSLASACFS